MFRPFERTGFNFDNLNRLEIFMQQGLQPPPIQETGTTIVGVIFNKGVILGADTRVTKGTLVSALYATKIFKVTDNVFCCGAGYSGDMENFAELLKVNMILHRLNTERHVVRVVAVKTLMKRFLHRYHGAIRASFIVGGYDCVEGPQLYSISSGGTSNIVPFLTVGSGQYGSMAVLDSRWSDDMKETVARQLVRDALVAGIESDLCSGASIDLCIIRCDGTVSVLKNFEKIEPQQKPSGYDIKKGTALVLEETVERIELGNDGGDNKKLR